MLTEEAEAIHDEFMLDTAAQKVRTLERLREFEAARAWTARNSPALHRRLIGALGLPVHFARDLSTLGEEILALAAQDNEHDVASARLLFSQGIVVGVGTDQKAASDIALQAAECYRQNGITRGQALGLSQAAHVLTFLGPDQIARGRELLRVAGEVAARDPDRRITDLLESSLAINHFASGDLETAEAMLRDIYADTARTDLISSFALSYLADCAVMAGRYEEALGRFAAFVREIRGTDTHNVLLQCVGIVAALSGLGRDAEAVELHAAVAATMPPHSSILQVADLYPDGPDMLERSRERLGPRAVAEAEQRGASRTVEDIEAWVVSMAPASVPV
jgi:hypothetical protein